MLLDVILEMWVPGTGCIQQGWSDCGGVGSCSNFGVAVTRVPSQKTKHLFPFPAVMETHLDHVK